MGSFPLPLKINLDFPSVCVCVWRVCVCCVFGVCVWCVCMVCVWCVCMVCVFGVCVFGVCVVCVYGVCEALALKGQKQWQWQWVRISQVVKTSGKPSTSNVIKVDLDRFSRVSSSNKYDA